VSVNKLEGGVRGRFEGFDEAVGGMSISMCASIPVVVVVRFDFS
jgi:hypothetical protein